jgi:Protein of unknown function (DUF2591)
MKTNELIGRNLDWAVSKALKGMSTKYPFPYSTDWMQGGPIIEHEKIDVVFSTERGWGAAIQMAHMSEGPTSLVAAMRCYVESKLGSEVEIPEELK